MNHQFEQQILDALKVLPAIQEAVSHIPYLMEQVKHIPVLVEKVDHFEWSLTQLESKSDYKFNLLTMAVNTSNSELRTLQNQFRNYEEQMTLFSSALNKIQDKTDRMEKGINAIRAQVASFTELAPTVSDHEVRIQHLEHKIG